MVKSLKMVYIILVSGCMIFLLSQCGEKNTPGDNQASESAKTESSNQSVIKGNPVNGKQLFDQTCAACHGIDAKGLPKLGKDLTTSKFVQDKSDQELVKFIEVGRLPNDPLNTTGVAMPPKGGNPALTDNQILDIISYLRQIHK